MCGLCSRKVKVKQSAVSVGKSLFSWKGGTTSNLRKHIQTAHSIAWSNIERSQASPSSAAKRPGSIDVHLKRTRSEEITSSIVDFIALDLRPISIVDGVGFRRLLYHLEPGYRVPSHTTNCDSPSTKTHRKSSKASAEA